MGPCCKQVPTKNGLGQVGVNEARGHLELKLRDG